MSTPYLARGAAHAIDWRPPDGALAEAARAGRPLLLVIGASFDHASHVLDERLDDDNVARVVRERFVAARADADARPDLDARYQALAGRARATWPLVVVLAPDATPLVAGAAVDRTDLAAQLSRWATAPAIPVAAAPPASTDAARSPAEWPAIEIESWHARADPQTGGFRPAPKSPSAPALALLMSHPTAWSPPFVTRTLDAMAQGGLHDHLAGGFHRRATDERWVVPLFGKRAVVQAAMIDLYACAAAQHPRFGAVVRATAAWAIERLGAPGGGFYAAEDADVGPYDDAGYFTWTVDEARAALDPDELAAAQPYYDIYGRGELNSDPTRNVLFVAASPSQVARELGGDEAVIGARLERARSKLLAARRDRPRPLVDESIYVGASAALARAMIEAGPLVDEAAHQHAMVTIDRLAAAALDDDGVRHRLDANDALRDWPDDAAQLGLAALAAARLTGDARYHRLAATAAARLRLDAVSAVDGDLESSAAAAARLLAALDDPRAAALIDRHLPAALAAGPEGAGVISLALARAAGDPSD